MAARYWVGGTANWDATAGTKWALTSGGAGGQAVPTSADDVFFTAASGAVTVSVSAAASCLTLIFTGYTGTFTINSGFTLTVTGTAITLGAGMTFTPGTTGILSTQGNQTAITINFNGIIIPNLTVGKLQVATIQTVTINGTSPTVRSFICSNTAGNSATDLAGTPLIITNSYAMNAAGGLRGVAPIFTGSVTMTQTSGAISMGFTVTTGSTLTLGSNILSIYGVITFAAGSFLIPSTYTFSISNVSTLDSNAIAWYNLTISIAVGAVQITSDLNIDGNLFINIYNIGTGITATSTRSVNVKGSVTGPAYYLRNINFANIILNLIGTGTFALPTIEGATSININTTNPSGYVIGSSTFVGANSMQLINTTLNLIGTSVASAFSGTTIAVSNSTLDTNRTLVGGSNPIYGAIIANSVSTFSTDTTCLGNLTLISGFSSSTINGAKILFGGNLINSVSVSANGTATLEFTGSSSATWGNGSYALNVIVNKSSGAVVTTGTAITWGAAGKTLTMNTAVNFATNSTTFTLAGTPLTINNSFGNSFFNLITPASTVNINGATTPITNNLTLSGLGATFAGAFGWTCKNLICSTAGSFNITLQELVTYRTTAAVSITGGTALARPTMVASGTGLAIWTLDFGATQSLIYVYGTRIDSSGGQTIWSFGVLITDVNTSINWNPGVPLRTVAYTFVT